MEYKTLTCKVCGEEFRPHKDHRYTVVKHPGLFIPSLFFDAIDCPHCGCQAIIGDRLGTAVIEDDEDDEDLNKDPSEESQKV